jgi:flagellar protein FlaJ
MAEDIIDLNQLDIKKKDLSKTILFVCVAIAAFLFALGALDGLKLMSLPLDWIDYVFFALMAFTGPYGIYTSSKYKRIREIETRLPEFLRDVAEAGRFGMTLASAIKVASRGRYGKLTPEIKRMAAQIDWGVPASDALRLFAERVDTPLVQRMVSIIIKANDAGGNVADVLTMVAHDARENLLNQNERRVNMATYTMVIYIAFAVFIATIFILNATFLPKMVEAGQSVAEATSKASNNFQNPTEIKTDVIPVIQMIFIVSVVIHAAGDGILAGVLQDGKIANGMRHSFIMLIIGFLGTRLI